jgi:3-dehydroquinate synthase
LTRIETLVEAAGLPTRPPAELARDRFFELMAVDKKVMDGRLRMVLMRGIGGCVVTSEFPQKELEATLSSY